MNMNKYVWGWVCLIMGCIILACNEEKPITQSRPLRVQISHEIDILNPALSRLSVSTFVESQLALPVAKWDESLRDWIPVLVESYKPEKTQDGVRYVLKLRPEARWSDGTPITVSDFLFTLKMGLNPYITHQSWAAYLSLISRVEATEDSLEIFLQTPYILADEFIASLIPYPSHVLDSAQLLKSVQYASFLDQDFSSDEDQTLRQLAQRFNAWGSPAMWPYPVSGLFQVSRWIPGQQVTISRIHSFWGGEVEAISKFYSTNFDSIHFVVIPDPQNALHAFTSGSVDVLSALDQVDTALITRSSGEAHDVPTLQMLYISVNHHHDLLENTQIRKALNLAIHRQDIVDRLFEGRGQPAYGPIHPAKSYYDPIPSPYDPEESRQILQNLNCVDKNGDGILECPTKRGSKPLSFQIWTTRSELSRNVATLLKGYWKHIGVELEIESADFRTFLPELQNRTYDMAALALRQNNLLDDPYPLWHSSQADAAGKNYQGLAHDSIDLVLENLRTSLVPKLQARYYRQFQQLFADQIPVFFLVAPGEMVVKRTGVDLYWTAQRPGFDLLRSRFTR